MGVAEDRLEILELISRYAHAADGKDPGVWADLFTEDGIFDVVARDGKETVFKGRDQLMATSGGWMSKRDVRQTRHNQVCPLILELSGDRAKVRTYSLRTEIPRDPKAEHVIATTGVYYDDIVRTPKGWRFAKRKHVADPYPQPEGVS